MQGDLKNVIDRLKKDSNWQRFYEEYLEVELAKINDLNEPMFIPGWLDNLTAPEKMIARAILIENIKILLAPITDYNLITQETRTKNSFR